MRRASLVAALAAAALPLTFARPAHAVPPVHSTITQHRVVEDQGQNCGFPVRWTIDLTADQQEFFDDQGRRIRTQAHIWEDNTIANLATGLVLREGPDAFLQTTHFGENGQVERIVVSGLAVRVEKDHLKDVGRVVLVPRPGGGFDIAFSAGPHPVREATTGPLAEALKAFCGVLS